MNFETVTLIIECVGIASFSISGTIVALSRKTDLFGALVFAMLTSFGGGLIRDTVLGITPPNLFVNPDYFLLVIICAAVSAVCFNFAFIKETAELINRHKNDFLLELFDAIGLASFCVTGVNVALEAAPEQAENAFLLIFCGCISGIGGGVLRDVVSGELPLIFRKNVYFIPALVGTLFYVFTRTAMDELLSAVLSIGIITAIRVPAIIFHWNLPVPGGDGAAAASEAEDTDEGEGK